MLTEIYIEALLVDEELADQVWCLWMNGSISTDITAIAWWLVAGDRCGASNPDKIHIEQ